MQPDRRASLKALAVLSGLSVLPMPLVAAPSPTTPEWLILVYMNGKNSLAADAIDDFMEMSAIGSSKAMSIVVQLGRIDDPSCNPSTYDGWSGVKRYLINKGTRPTSKEALVHVGGARDATADMGAIATLDEFIAWGTAKYPAKKKILVIWNHGQGWRLVTTPEARILPRTDGQSACRTQGRSGQPIYGNYRSVSSDDDHRSILHNKEIQSCLEKWQEKNVRFDIVAYDACLMAMVETAYSLRKVTDFLVASQELELGAGWDHTRVLKKLADNSNADPEAFAKMIVASYREKYRDVDHTTLSAVRLANIDNICRGISRTADALRANADVTFAELRTVRNGLLGFADHENLGFTVDCETLFARLASVTQNTDVRREARAVADQVHEATIENYASVEPAASSPRGLALYFPKTRSDFNRDFDRLGYLRSNTLHPVDFVADVNWSLLLRDFLALPA